MARLTQVQRERAIAMLQCNRSISEIARTFGCTRATVYALQRRFQQTGVTTDTQRSGRPRVTTPREDRHIRLSHLRNRFLTATVTAANMQRRQISAQTVRRRLRGFGLCCRRPYRGPILERRHRQARLQWARQHLNWRRVDWNNVIFSDESRYQLLRADGRARVYRRRGERYADPCVNEVDRFGLGSVMVWGGICGGRKTRLRVINGNLTAQRYIDQVLQPEVVPFIRQNGRGLVFQHDNARPHTARLTQDFLRRNNVQVLPWPSRSPDMSPIEHLWDELDRRVRKNLHPRTLPALARALEREWQNIPANVVQRYVDSMRRRLQAMIAANGGHTRY